MRARAHLALLATIASLAAPALTEAARPLLARGGQSGRPLALTIPVAIEGSVQVDFASSVAAGCDGRCNFSGSLTWNPTGRADLAVDDVRSSGRNDLQASLFFFGGLGQDAPRTTAHVIRDQAGRAGVCSDARANALTFLDFSVGLPTTCRWGCSRAGPTTPISSAHGAGVRSSRISRPRSRP